MELLTPDGNYAVVPYNEVKAVQFVKDFEPPDPASERKVFSTRPKMDGLWVRVKFRDGEVMDGILANNLLLTESHGFTVVPPDPYSNNQRLFLPHRATGTRSRRKPSAAAKAETGPEGTDRAVRLIKTGSQKA